MRRFLELVLAINSMAVAPVAQAEIQEKLDDRGLVVSRRSMVDGQAGAGFEVDYTFEESLKRFISTGFRVFDKDGKLVRARSAQDPLPCGLKSPAKQERALVMDIVPADIRNPIFKDKILVNANETLNGIDDDGNGLIDDCAGYSMQDWKNNAPLVAPMLDAKGKLFELDSKSLIPDVDHATISLSIAARDLKNVDFISVGGHLQKQAYYKAVTKTIADEKVRFVNISLGVPGLSTDNDGETFSDPAAYNGMKSLIEKSPTTLFVVAAGNGGLVKGMGLNIDRIGLYPAAFWMPNILAVAAANTNEITRANITAVKLADFSNVGVSSVDVVAPGVNMHGALSGGTWTDTAKGTSFASPYVMNLALKLALKYPKLDIFDIKELIMKTVYIPDFDLALRSGELGSRLPIELEVNPRFFAVRSAGVVFPLRLFKAAQIFTTQAGISIEDACLKARSQTLVKGETMDESKLHELWILRRMSPMARQ